MALDIFGVSTLDDDVRRELIRKELHNLTTSYSDEADVFTEIIQNAVDAIARRIASESDVVGELVVVIGRRKNNAHYIYVQDNGTGMPPEVADKVFIPSFSFGKEQGKSIGYKGVGMSYVLAISDHMAMKTLSGGVETCRTVRHTHDWVIDSEKPQPAVTEDFDVPKVVEDLAKEIQGAGTGVFYGFHPGANPPSLDNLVIVTDGIEKELRYWTSLLCARTPLGLAASETHPVVDPIKVRMVLDQGDDVREESFTRETYDLSHGKIGYPYPEKVFRVGVDTKDIDKTPQSQWRTKHERKHQAVFHEWSAADLVEEMQGLDDDERTLLLTHLHWIRGYLCYSTDVMKTVRQTMGTRSSVVRYGARLSVDGAPQGRPLDLALTSDQGLDRQTHIVLGFRELGLDTGRKFVSNERILSAANKVNQRVVTILKDYRWALKVKDRAPVESDLDSWKSSISARSGNSSIPALFDALGAVPPARVDPDNEQEVIALWTALVTTGTLPGFRMKAISGYNRYDALVDITAEAISGTGELAVVSTDFLPKKDAVLEFKWSFEDLIADFEQKVKIPGEIDLVVCWDCPDVNLRIGSLAPTYGHWQDERPLRAASYNWSDDAGSTQFRVIALRNVVAELIATKGVGAGSAALEILVSRDKEKLV